MTARTTDIKGRWRSKTIAFRMSEEEASQLDLLVSLSGLSKQDFIIRALLDPEIHVHATVRMHRAIRKEIGVLTAELRRIRQADDMSDRLMESVETIARFAGSFEPEYSPVDREDNVIRNLTRGGGDTRQSTTTAPIGNPKQ